MFLLVSVCHVGAHRGEHQHGVSVQISVSLGKTFLQKSRMWNIPLTWILARVFVYVPTFISQILDFIYSMVLIYILIYFEWRDTENQQLGSHKVAFIMYTTGGCGLGGWGFWGDLEVFWRQKQGIVKFVKAGSWGMPIFLDAMERLSTRICNIYIYRVQPTPHIWGLLAVSHYWETICGVPYILVQWRMFLLLIY